MDSEVLRQLPQGHLRAVEVFHAPLRLVQQPVLPEVHRVHAGRGGNAPEQMVRGLSRSRRLLQRPLRPAHQGTDRYAGSAGRARLHVVPRHRARGQHHGQRRFHRGVSAAARTGLQQEQVHPRHRLLPDLSQPQAAQGHLHEAVHAGAIGRVLRLLPQGAPRCSGEQLPLGARVQRLRQLAGQRRFRTGRALVLLSAEDLGLLGLPHAAGGVERSGQPRWQGPFASLSGREYGGAHRQSGRGAIERHRAVSEVRLHHRGHLRRVAGRRPHRADGHAAAQRNRAGHVHVRRRRRGRAERGGGDSRGGQGVGADRRGGQRA